MIGFVASQAAVQTIVGVPPIPRWRVRTVKARMWLQGNLTQLFMLAVPVVGMAAFLTAGVVFGDWLVVAPCIGILAWVEHGFVRSLWRHRSLMARWLVGPVVEISDYADGRGCYAYITPWGYFAIPIRTQAIVARLRRAGLTPQVEYFDADPFLFVEIKGRRVYLDHW